MDTSDCSIKSNSESEEDYRTYFLQPSASPYNVTEKIQQANLELFNAYPINNKSVRVQFREDLVSYEPDLTDDDVVSLESDQINELEDATSPIQYRTEIRGREMSIFDIEEEENDEIIEEIVADFEGREEDEIKMPKIEQSTHENVEFVEKKSAGERTSRTNRLKRRKHRHKEVNCKNECLDRLETDFERMRLSSREQSSCVYFPPLKLRERACCLEQKARFLPIYNGARSEYGLSRMQLEKRERQLIWAREKEGVRAELLREYKKRRMEQNEAVFLQWLRNKNVVVNKRGKSGNGINRNNEQWFANGQANVISTKIFGEKGGKERSKSANGIFAMSGGQNCKRRRPKTTTSVYIQVPERVLRVGLQIGDLLVTDNSLMVKKLHILAIS